GAGVQRTLKLSRNSSNNAEGASSMLFASIKTNMK
nr:hypothetical protein [Tanacetum cinerariifolium]